MKGRARWAAAGVALAAAGLGGCDNSLRPPTDAGVCYHFVQFKNGAHKFNVLANGVPNLETCAARLEGMRIAFLRLGGSQSEIVGAFQSKFIFIQNTGVFASDSLDGASYLALLRSGDGRLVIPGAARLPPKP